MKTALDPKIDFQMTTISRIVRDRSGRRHPEYTGGAPKRHDFVTYEDRKCLMLGSNFQVVLRDAWMDGMPANTQDSWVNELLDRADLFPFAGPDKYVLDLEVAYSFVKTHHPHASIRRFWEALDWSKAPRLGGCLIDTIQRILTTLSTSPSYATLGEKLGWGDILWLGNCRVMVLSDNHDQSLTDAWGGWIEAPVRLLSRGPSCDQEAYTLMASLPDVFPEDGFGSHGVSSHYDYVVIDLDAAYDAVMEAQPWATIPRVWDSWAWRKAPSQPLAKPEEYAMRQENEALREEVRQLRQAQEQHRTAPKVDITLDVSEGLSPRTLECLQESLLPMVRAVVLLHEGQERSPEVTCKINVPSPQTSLKFT
jgi:hypothetical protein